MYSNLIPTSVLHVLCLFYVLGQQQPSESVTLEQAEHIEPTLAADTSTGTFMFFFYFVGFKCESHKLIQYRTGLFFCILRMDTVTVVFPKIGERLTEFSEDPRKIYDNFRRCCQHFRMMFDWLIESIC